MMQLLKGQVGLRTLVPGILIGVGAGFATVNFALYDHLVWRPVQSVEAPAELYSVPGLTQYRSYIDTEAQLRLTRLAGIKRSRADVWVANSDNSAGSVSVECGTATYFDVVGVRPTHGRVWLPGDRDRSAIVISARFRRRHFDSTEPLGASVRLGGAQFTVIGVLPRTFAGLTSQPPDVFIPLEGNADTCLHRGRDLFDSGNWLWAIGRVPSNPSAASDELRGAGINTVEGLVPLLEARRRSNAGITRSAGLCALAALLVLVLSWSAAAGLYTTQGLARRREYEIRHALGASRWAIARHCFSDQIAGLGAAALLAIGSMVLLERLLSSATVADIGVAVWERRSVLFCTICLVAGTLLTGTVIGYRSSTLGRTPRLPATRGRLVWAQAACAVFLVSGALAASRGLTELWKGAGFDIAPLLLVGGDAFAGGHRSPAEMRRAFDQLRSDTLLFPGVAEASVGSSDLLWADQTADIAYLQSSTDARTLPAVAVLHGVTARYASTVGIELLSGRWISDGDDDRGNLVAVLDASAAQQLWPGENPLGRCIFFLRDTRCLSVVGVIKARRAQLLLDQRSEVFLPLKSALQVRPDIQVRNLIVRLSPSADAGSVAGRLGIRTRDLGLPGLTVKHVAGIADGQTRSLRQAVRVLGAAGAMALTVGLVGFLSSLALLVSQQTREIAVRVALGASGRQVVVAMVAPLLRAALAGLVTGAIAIVLASRLIESVTYGVSAVTVDTLAASCLAFACAALIGAALPILKALRISPSIMLRL